MKKLCFLLILSSLIAGEASAAPTKKKAKKESAIELFRQAETAADEYRFADAADLLERYEEALPRRGKAPVTDEELTVLTDRVERGRLMMDRVERIVVIDSITVPKKDFFTAYRLDPSAGSLRSTSVLPGDLDATDDQPVFVPESGLTMMWAMPDSSGRSVIAELSLLADGSYEPVMEHPELNIAVEEGSDSINALYPFMMADGLTLYYAMDNPELSMGGLDIFFSRRDGNRFMQPQNMGMPYNSPADDYMLAIDETTGTGWWATERNYPGSDSVTIYRFIPNSIRENYNSDETPDLASLARLDSWRATQPAGADYSELLSRPIARIGGKKAEQIRIAIPGRGVVTSLSELRTRRGKDAAKELMEANESLAKTEERLASLRKEYAHGNHSTSTEILNLERRINSIRNKISSLKNAIVSAER